MSVRVRADGARRDHARGSESLPHACARDCAWPPVLAETVPGGSADDVNRREYVHVCA